MLICAGNVACDEALACIATPSDLFPVEMAMRPFSLTTRLMAKTSAMTLEEVVRRAGDDRNES